MKTESLTITKEKNEIVISDLRDSLKTTMQNEVKKLPELLEKLDSKERINVLCKLMPYVFPKVETVHSKED